MSQNYVNIWLKGLGFYKVFERLRHPDPVFKRQLYDCGYILEKLVSLDIVACDMGPCLFSTINQLISQILCKFYVVMNTNNLTTF